VPNFAANLTLMFPDAPFPERFARAAKAGFRAAEFLFPYDHTPGEVAAWLKENRLENVLFNLPPGDWAKGERGLTSVPGREEEFKAGVAKAIEYAKVLGTKRLHPMAGLLTPAGAAAHQEVYIKNLRYAAREFAKHSLTAVIEPINTRDIPGFFLNRQDQADAAREAVGEPNLKIQMDIYHAQIVEGDVSVKLRKYMPHIAHMQIASVPDRHEPDEGELNYKHLFALIDALGYDGWIGCEYRPRARTEDGLGWMKTLVG
jgi:2-dehydrotetronate isomerase